MDQEFILRHTVMTDAKGSRSNIAAKFQNAINIQVLPPIGVFWDIENCQVPKGKSASTLVIKIRELFFKKHREAEFMCVCDIHKESKAIIQELNDAQVTVVHIEAISKNAADEKLRQCMRRFVDTHRSPATLLLISDDVNFATDLSDFRHRHSIRIILLHRNHVSEPLLACAHEHYDFSSLASHLPMRSPMKVPHNRPHELVVTDLPTTQSSRQIQKRLKRLSDNCGGKVASLKGTNAVVRFANADAAERAQKRMDKETVFGNKISVNFLYKNGTEGKEFSPYKNQSKDNNSPCEPSGSSESSRDSSLSPLRLPNTYENDSDKSETKVCKKLFDFPPPPILNSQNSPIIKQSCISKELSDYACENFTNSLAASLAADNKCLQNGRNAVLEENASSPSRVPYFSNISSSYTPKEDSNLRGQCPPKSVGRVSPFVLKENGAKPVWTASAISHNDLQSVIRRNVNPHSELTSNPSLQTFHGYPSVAQGLDVSFSNLSRNADPVNFPLQRNCVSLPSSENVQPVSKANPILTSDFPTPIELVVTNLDSNFEVNEMKKILLSVFREHIMVLHISMVLQTDGSAKAIVKVPSLHDAQFAISRLHHRKIGHKRILISYVTNDKLPPFHILKSEVLSLLHDIPLKNLPLITFRDIYYKRYDRQICVAELYKMRDAVCVQEDNAGRTISLNQDYHNTLSSTDSDNSQDSQVLEKPYCERHFHFSESRGWAEQDSVYPLPNVCISLRTLATAVHTLLDSHQGALPLNSFCACYEADIGPLPIINTESPLGEIEEHAKTDEASDQDSGSSRSSGGGVPLEHLIACITGIEISKSPLCIKKVQWSENKLLEAQAPVSAVSTMTPRSISPALAGQLTLFGREMMDLLKNQPLSIVPFNKFIPIYHHHFGRQCRVADYGFTKLIDLLEAIPHIVQVLGQGQNRSVTLTHRSQVKRFAADLMRILKSRANKQVTLSEFPSAYEQCIEKPFGITNYGVCDVLDMLNEVSENVIVMTNAEDETIIGIPKREQTPEEIERTKQFAAEVVELLKHTPSCRMTFNKFIPAYHHHFGKQCRVADYGFSKLIELFEAVPDVLEMLGSGEDKVLVLTDKERHKILSDRIISVLKTQPNNMIALHLLSDAYAQIHGHMIRPADFGACDLPDLLKKLRTSLKVAESYAGAVVTLVDRGFVRQSSLRLRRLLMEQMEGKLSLEELNWLYHKRFGHVLDLTTFHPELEDVIIIENNFVKLTSLQMLARDVIILLYENGTQMPLQNFEEMFLKRFGVPFRPAQYGFPSVAALFSALPEYFITRGRKHKRMILLNRETAGSPLPNLCVENPGQDHMVTSFITNKATSNDQLMKTPNSFTQAANSDILNEPVPSCVPSPILKPKMKIAEDKDLMGFETPVDFTQDVMSTSVKDEQKTAENTSICKKPLLPTPAMQYDDTEALLKALMTLPPPPATPSPPRSPQSPAVTLPHYTVVHQYNNISPFPNVQTSPVTYFFSPPSACGHLNSQMPSSPVGSHAVILHQPSVIPFHAVVSSPGVPSFEAQSASSTSTIPVKSSLSANFSYSQNTSVCGVAAKSQQNKQPMSSAVKRHNSDVAEEQEEANSASFEDLSKSGDISFQTSGRVGVFSSHSTPSHVAKKSQSRIAAHFSIPLKHQNE